MTREEILQLAIDAGVQYRPRTQEPKGFLFPYDGLDKFAELIIAAVKAEDNPETK